MKQRYIPTDYTMINYPESNAIIYRGERGIKFYALSYSGKRSNPDFHIEFSSLENREKYINNYLTNLKNNLKAKIEKKQREKDFQHTLKVNDILYSSWGYDQTNIDFYQIIDIKGKMVKVKQIKKISVDENQYNMTSHVMPDKNNFKNEEILSKKVLKNNVIKINHYYAQLFDGNPKYESYYA